MAEEKNMDENKDVQEKRPNIGDTIHIKKGKQKGKKGKVIVLRENSVIVELGVNPSTGEPIKTVVNHNNYKH
ncbi:DUF2187 family protein [Bacillus sp. V3B]|uniref:DUF2187 family protein n=1 Tax=Bacillus sp. V3B TaxID=2804915 RepID=UPI00210878AB|nr:DUF2187 family protein [Bacillus sp. V3B]MCQ6276888.1 DUF2187 family protein [Bacillus sp. V3B]